MAKRSDFAQKLLDDLRLRKERLAASQSSNRTNPKVADAYTYSKRTYKGLKEIKTPDMTANQNGKTKTNFSGGNNNAEVSNQLIPFEQGQSSNKFRDLSMALAFAFENEAKLTRIASSGTNSMLSFLHQFGRRSMDYGNMDSSIDRYQLSNSSFPAMSYLQLREISKGAQKLYQILRACSGGLNFDRYSIEIGKELLKGAMDLEDSLRMLVSLQEASDYLTSPQRKSRITVLENDEDDDTNTAKIAEQKKMDRPRFSFDKLSKKYHDVQEVARTDLKARLAALTLPNSNSSSHKRSISYGPNVKVLATFSERTNSACSPLSKAEKPRIPNVIAKLMGLDELPENVDSKHNKQKDSTSKPKMEGIDSKRTAKSSIKKTEQKTEDIEHIAFSTVKQKAIQASKTSASREGSMLHTGNNLPPRNVTTEVAIHNEALGWKDFEHMKQVTGSPQKSIRIERQDGTMINVNDDTGNQKDLHGKESKHDTTKHREKRGIEKAEAKEQLFNNETHSIAPQRRKRQTSQEESEYDKDTFQIENRYKNKLMITNQGKIQNNLGSQQSLLVERTQSQQTNRQAEERSQTSVIQKLQVKKQKRSDLIVRLSKPIHDSVNVKKKQLHVKQAAISRKSSVEFSDSLKSKGSPDVRNQETFVRDEQATNSNVKQKDSTKKNTHQYSSLKKIEPGLAQTETMSSMKEKPVHIQAVKKIKEKVHKTEIPQKINEVMTRRNDGLENLTRPLKYQNLILQVKQRRQEKIDGSEEADKWKTNRLKEAEVCNIKSHKSEETIQPSTMIKQLRRGMPEDQTVNIPREDKCQSLKELPTPASIDSCQKEILIPTNDQKLQDSSCSRDQELKSLNISSDAQIGSGEGSQEILHLSQLEHQTISESEKPEPLTESEEHLKQILITSQLFLNTVEALFKLNIPIGIPRAGEHDYHDKDSKLILACGYEVAKRKGKRQELSVHPFMKLSITFVKVVQPR
ncbi:uncharacterized protein LOC110816799 isoform X2 [Carica papaya]|uniref:uncharacterized protein LOC110816799 isoform X2 n=1 Tax=Carica papaya TaxID=3649 RepID=UPI000B8CA919|nr:uncharacterized protein LOC110816799 isoform X2 [Carica papaya]